MTNRNSGYHYIFTDRKTGAVITEGMVTGGNKTDCTKLAWIRFNDARKEQNLPYKAHYIGNDEVQLFMERKDPMTEKERQQRVAASMRYNAKNVKQIKMNLNLKTDVDIIDHLDKCTNVQGYIKDLIRKDITEKST